LNTNTAASAVYASQERF